jgi:flagellar motor switch protein FliN
MDEAMVDELAVGSEQLAEEAAPALEEAPTPDTQDPTPEPEPSDLPPPTSDLPPPTSDLPPPTSDLPPPTSDLLDPTPEPEPVEDVPDPGEDLALHLLDVNVRLWGELGRAKLPLSQAVALGSGAIVDLDKEPDDALDVLVNGLPFAKGRLLLVDGEWAIRLEEIVASSEAVEQASSSGSGA